jgi:hypothetical protein
LQNPPGSLPTVDAIHDKAVVLERRRRSALLHLRNLPLIEDSIENEEVDLLLAHQGFEVIAL